MASKRRKIAVISGFVAVLAVGFATLLRWDDVQVWMHVRALTREPELFEESLVAEEGSVEERAFRRFLNTSAGQERYLRKLIRFLVSKGTFVLGVRSQASQAVSPA
ncbi:MAG: hypothetical protein AAF517_22715 [Planctomycetota bacterium]